MPGSAECSCKSQAPTVTLRQSSVPLLANPGSAARREGRPLTVSMTTDLGGRLELFLTCAVLLRVLNTQGEYMRNYFVAALLLASTLPLMAQNPPANPNGSTPAVNTPSTTPNPGAPVAGANSFTESQAKSRIEAKGYTNVTGLTKDSSGVWRGTASQSDNKSMSVSVDFQGNVVARQ